METTNKIIIPVNNNSDNPRKANPYLFFKKNIVFLKNIFSLMITCFIIILLFSNVNIFKLGKNIQQIDLRLVVAAIILSMVTNMIIATERIKRILNALNCDISFKEVFLMKMGSTPLKILPSSKINLFSQIIYLKKYKNFSFLFGINAVIFGLILNILALLTFISIGSIFYFLFKNSGLLREFSYIFYALFISSIFILLFFLVIKSGGTQNKILYFLNNINKKLCGTFLKFVSIYNNLENKKIIFLWIYSIILQFSEIFICYILCKSLGLNIHFYIIILFIPLVILISNLPISISGIGIRESAILLFFYTYGTREELLSLGILIFFIEYMIPVFIGLFFINSFLIKISK
ncbi:MAG: lysylphosphatidylglycerol synthase transmembrane domain-containing protein [Candidatus Omnitrophota bacterium]